jgi:hypothetical protein
MPYMFQHSGAIIRGLRIKEDIADYTVILGGTRKVAGSNPDEFFEFFN